MATRHRTAGGVRVPAGEPRELFNIEALAKRNSDSGSCENSGSSSPQHKASVSELKRLVSSASNDATTSAAQLDKAKEMQAAMRYDIADVRQGIDAVKKDVEEGLRAELATLKTTVQQQQDLLVHLQTFIAPKAFGLCGKEARATGLNIFQARAAGYSCAEVYDGGYSCAEAKMAGFTTTDVREAGYSLEEVKDAGFVEGLKAAGYRVEELKATGFTPQECCKAGFSFPEGKAAGYHYVELCWNGIFTPWNGKYGKW